MTWACFLQLCKAATLSPPTTKSRTLQTAERRKPSLSRLEPLPEGSYITCSIRMWFSMINLTYKAVRTHTVELAMQSGECLGSKVTQMRGLTHQPSAQWMTEPRLHTHRHSKWNLWHSRRRIHCSILTFFTPWQTHTHSPHPSSSPPFSLWAFSPKENSSQMQHTHPLSGGKSSQQM